MVKINLTKGLHCVISEMDFEFVNKHKWHAHESRGKFYAASFIDKERILMHRFIMGIHGIKGMFVDHINGDGLDNQRENLRLSTLCQNQHNRKLNSNSKTGFKGVTVSGNKYLAQIKINGQAKRLGRFSDPNIAAMAYNKAAVEIYGEFARLNQI